MSMFFIKKIGLFLFMNTMLESIEWFSGVRLAILHIT